MANRNNGIRLHVHLIGYTFSAPREILFLSLEGKKLSYQTKNMLVNNKKNVSINEGRQFLYEKYVKKEVS